MTDRGSYKRRIFEMRDVVYSMEHSYKDRGFWEITLSCLKKTCITKTGLPEGSPVIFIVLLQSYGVTTQK